MNLQMKKYRLLKKLSQEEVAAKLGIKPTRYGSWERGERKMSFSQACDVADVLECTLDELAGRWEYVQEPKYTDPRQVALNGHYGVLSDESKDDLVKFAKSFAADPERRALKDSPDTAADTASVA